MFRYAVISRGKKGDLRAHAVNRFFVNAKSKTNIKLFEAG